MSLHQILLQPTDVLFFRDGRPMGGSLAGHTAAWPLPDVTNHALHAALHRADLETLSWQKLHTHRRGRSGQYSTDDSHRDKKFGSLATAGPFPVRAANQGSSKKQMWFFPRPADSKPSTDKSVEVTFFPAMSDGEDGFWTGGSLATPLRYAVGNAHSASKDAGGEPWISGSAFDAYLRGAKTPAESEGPHFINDSDIADREHQIGIGIDPETQAQDGERFYSAHYLRLREQFRLGLLAEAMDKINGNAANRRDLIPLLLNDSPSQIVVGGQQRICTAHRSDTNGALSLPTGFHQASDFKRLANGKFAVKWILLSPAIWPGILKNKKDGSAQNPHPGGWLPNWISLDWDSDQQKARPNAQNGQVLLTAGPGVRKAARKGGSSGSRISACLVAAIVPKPQVVTGWALPDETADHPAGGAKPTLLAVPAGAIYYFEAEPDANNGPGNAIALAAALNWHGTTDGTEIKNRRSTLMGEKGFGLGVCGTWKFFGT